MVQTICNNNHAMCDSYLLTLRFVINKVDVSYVGYNTFVIRKHVQSVDVLYRPVCS